VLRSDMATGLRIPRPSVHLGLDLRPRILYAYFPTAHEAHTSRSSTDKFGEAQAEGVVAVLALVLLAFGAALMVH